MSHEDVVMKSRAIQDLEEVDHEFYEAERAQPLALHKHFAEAPGDLQRAAPRVSAVC